MKDNFKHLNGYGVYPSELVFDDNEFSIQRPLISLYFNIAFAILMISSGIASIVDGIQNHSINWAFYLQIGLTSILVMLLLLVLYLVFRFQKLNKKIYSYKDIKTFEVKQDGTFINLKIHFLDNSTDRIKLYRNTKSKGFIELLNSTV
jgi:hypothetical protein